MIKLRTIISVLAIVVIFTSCTIEPKPIAYGSDMCHSCQMAIVDPIHAAEIVTTKGKVFKFDASECMISYTETIGKEKISLFMTNCFEKPRELIDSQKAIYLVSKNLPSPMGAFLTAFQTKEEAEETKAKLGGKLYEWANLPKFN